MNTHFNSKKFLIVVSMLVLFLAILVVADHIITPASKNIIEDTTTFLNITINNTDVGATVNITQVNITIPSNFTYLFNGVWNTSISATSFSNTSTVLSWTVPAGFIINATTQHHFWFNVTGANPGTFQLAVMTKNSSKTSYSNISITVNDTTAPIVTFITPSPAHGGNITTTSVGINVSANDNTGTGVVEAIVVRLYNSTHNQVNWSNSTRPAASYFVNLTSDLASLVDGVYYMNATANDSYGNTANTSTYTFRVDLTKPLVEFGLLTEANNTELAVSNVYANVSASDTYEATILFGLYRSGVVVEENSYSDGTRAYNWTGLNDGRYEYNVTITDFAGNKNWTETREILIQTAAAVASTSGSSTNAGTPSGVTYNPSQSNLEQGYTTSLRNSYKVNFNVGSEKHTVTVGSVSNNQATITVSSTPQTATLNVGETKKFDSNGDDYYDVSVYLKSVSGTTGVFTLTLINEKMPESAVTGDAVDSESDSVDGTTAGQNDGEGLGTSRMWIIVAVVVLILVVIAIIYATKNNSSNRRRQFGY